MNSQGFPLWAVHPEGDVYAVVGWDVREAITYPYLVPLGGNVRGVVREDGDHVFRYTTTDPTPREELTNLRERLTALGAELEAMDSVESTRWCAARIRQELAK